MERRLRRLRASELCRFASGTSKASASRPNRNTCNSMFQRIAAAGGDGTGAIAKPFTTLVPTTSENATGNGHVGEDESPPLGTLDAALADDPDPDTSEPLEVDGLDFVPENEVARERRRVANERIRGL